MQERTADEWMEIFRTNGNVAAEPLLTSQEALDHPDLVANGDVVDVEDAALGTLRQLGVLARLTATPGTPGGAAPLLGAHTEEVLAEERPALQVVSSAAPPPPGRPLEGVTVLEVSTIIAAPLATAFLADLGGRVIKVEAIEGDPHRHLLPRGVLAVKTNAGKESICLDLKSPTGQKILHQLARGADVVIHNFRPGVPERLGLGSEQIRALRPDVVWVSVTGYGPESPGARRPCAHPVAGAAAGGVVLQAGADMPPRQCSSREELRDAARRLMRANESNPDPNTSVVATSAILLGLLARSRRGIGQSISVTMLGANAYANVDDMLRYDGKPDRPVVDAGLFGLGACYRLYRAREGWVFLAVPRERDWRAFEQLFLTRDADEWQALLLPQSVGCVRADCAMGAFWSEDPHVLSEALTPEVSHERFGKIRRWGPLVVCDGGPPSLRAGVLAGADTDALLGEIGYTHEEIEQLRQRGIAASEPL